MGFLVQEAVTQLREGDERRKAFRWRSGGFPRRHRRRKSIGMLGNRKDFGQGVLEIIIANEY